MVGRYALDVKIGVRFPVPEPFGVEDKNLCLATNKKWPSQLKN